MTRRSVVDIATRDGVCPSIVASPDGDGPWPGVLMFMDAGGVRPAMVDMAEHLAAMGYVVLLPELYYRSGPYRPFDGATAFTDPDERARLRQLVGTLTKAGVASDTEAFLDHLSALPTVSGTKLGTTGYCMGGGFSLVAAARYPDRIAASASFHGGNLASDAPDSPHLGADRITARVYVAAAEDDRTFPPEQAARLEDALTAAGVDHVIETYAAAHGFAVPDMPTFDARAADRHWQALADLYSATLPT